jgi:hypothetical protein
VTVLISSKILTCSLLSTLGAGGVFAALSRYSRLRRRTWDEYYPHLREFDWNEASVLFNREEEDRVLAQNPMFVRREQRARLDLAIEMIGRAHHNTHLSFQWIYTEWRDMNDHHLEYEPELVEAMRKALSEIRRFMWMARYDLGYMRVLGLFHFNEWRFMPVPSVAARRKVFDNDVLQAYQRVKRSVADFARLAYSQEEVECILAKM